MHWAFHSCNGLSVNTDVKVWGEPHLWRDVLARHQANHLHAVVGGGDQIYNDGFWKTKPFKDWLDVPNDKVRLLPYSKPYTLSALEFLAAQACLIRLFVFKTPG